MKDQAMSDVAVQRFGVLATSFIGLVAAMIWSYNAVLAIHGEGEVSTRALTSGVALVLAGMALGVILSLMSAPLRLRRLAQADNPFPSWDQPAQSLLLGLMLIGSGAMTMLGTTAGAMDWTLAGFLAFVGGLNLGGAFAIRT